jgi:4-alpha-glucanotransferase
MPAATPLQRLADLAGIEMEYEDARGELQVLSPERLSALLGVLRVETGGKRGIASAVTRMERQNWERLIPPTQLIREGGPLTLPVSLRAADRGELAWRVTEEGGREHAGRARIGELAADAHEGWGPAARMRVRLELPLLLPPGYHELELATPDGQGSIGCHLIVAPEEAYLPPALASGERSWGFAVQLYALRSERNWGMGDFTDLAAAAELSAELGAGVLGVNPLHAGHLSDPEDASPYGPTSRMLLNILYLDVEAVEDFADCRPARDAVAAPAFQARLAQLREKPLVDYAGVASAKLEILELLWRAFRERHLIGSQPSQQAREFAAFRSEGGGLLQTWASSEAGRAAAAADEFDEPDEPDEQRIGFYVWLQWQAQRQLSAVRARCAELGMPVGLYLDLAVGVSKGGADVSADPEAYVATASAGAPPDIFNPMGQNWGLPPLHPSVLRDRGFKPFADVLRANMRHAGALRVDHILALLHLYWIPDGKGADEGGYVRYPLEEMLGVLTLESHRNRCLVIGEDLGTVPRSFRERLRQAGILSYRLLYFEQGADGEFVPPEAYPKLALASVSTHDLPTLPGFWEAHDLEVRSQLGLFPSAESEKEARQMRERDRSGLYRALRAEGLLREAAEPEHFDEGLLEACYSYIARSPSLILMVQFEDILGQLDQANLPGTLDEHPNWRRKLELGIDELGRLARVRQLAKKLKEARAASAPAARGGADGRDGSPSSR